MFRAQRYKFKFNLSIFVGSNKDYMDQINIYSGSEVISHIYVGNSIDGLKACLEPYHNVFVVMDSDVAMLCPAAYQVSQMLNKRGVPGMLVETSEEAKSIETVLEICGWLLENGANRDALVLAIGGGVVSDIVGFAASIYKRGVRFAYVPTTLLSQVDAAIGGKTGVNYNGYKNVLGIIRQPQFTYICPQVLESLPRRDFLSGAAELLKTFIIEDGGYFSRAVEWLSGYARAESQEAASEYLSANVHGLVELIEAAARVKVGIVSKDQYERGGRRKLNLGHTFAHAIETLAKRKGNDITHGEAVSMGILLAAELADAYALEKGISVPSAASDDFMNTLAGRLDADFLACGLPIGCPFRVSSMLDIMRKDKKAYGDKVRFVLPFAVGDVRVVELSVEEVGRLLAGK